MILFGYIKPFIEYSFAIPIYQEQNQYYYHSLDGSFLIKDFVEANIDKKKLIQLDDKLPIKENQYGFIIFIGEDYFPLIGTADTEIINIRNYLDAKKIEESAFIRQELAKIRERTIKSEISGLSIQPSSNVNEYKRKLLNHFDLSPSDLENLPEHIDGAMNQFINSYRIDNFMFFSEEMYKELYLVNCEYINLFDLAIYQQSIKIELEKICHEMDNISINNVDGKSFPSIVPNEKHFKRLPTMFLYPYFLTNERKQYSSVIPWGKQTHFSFLLHQKYKTYIDWNRLTNTKDIPTQYQIKKLHHIDPRIGAEKKRLWLDFFNSSLQEEGLNFIKMLFEEMSTQGSKMYYMKGFIFDELISEFSFENNLEILYGKIIGSQLNGTAGKLEDSYCKSSPQAGIQKDVILFDPGDIYNNLTFNKYSINRTIYTILNLNHNINIDVGVGFSLNALPFLLKNRNWERLQNTLTSSINKLVNQEDDIENKLQLSGIRINDAILEEKIKNKRKVQQNG